ncbi:metal ABC transporter permease subunit [Enterococcus dispar]|uniref:metal ABC transporter permease subunit n=1 Tax=Enterococcus dispar TaxID=44009 RepID=UPI002805ABC9|nr:metal ABC transporter permease subunit [Enterococcus dispar]MDT2706429.1 metal ABC transporter permease subunit [Enterococcus dispar]
MIAHFIAGLHDYHFLQNALITSIVIGIVSGAIGCFIILRGMSLMGDAISHAVLPGVALSYILGINFFVGAVVFGILASVLITYIANNSTVKSDTAIGITFSSFLALGIILIGIANSSTDLFHILFGNVLAVQDIDKWITISIAAVVSLLLIIFYRPLLLTSFDPMMAKAFGMQVNRYHYLLMLMLTLVSVTAMQSVGTILVVALLITPAATAYLFTKRLKSMILLAATLGGLSSLIGLFIGYSFNIAAGSAIVLTAASLFLIGFFLSPKKVEQTKTKQRIFTVIAVMALIGMGMFSYQRFLRPDDNAAENKLTVVATNSIIADMVKEVAGDKVNLHSIVPVGKNPHEYEPLPVDVRNTQEADVIFYNGLNLETGGNGWFTKLMVNGNKKTNEDYFAVSDGVEVIYLEGEEQGKADPHAWLNIENGILYAKNIASTLIAKDPVNKETYRDNLAKYVEKLTNLDNLAKEQFASIPLKEKLIVTSEGCFKYFSKAYDIPSAYIWEINTEEEGTPNQITTLVTQLKESNVKALFVESSVNKKPMQSVTKDSGIPIYGEVFTDSIAEPGNRGDSYYDMMKENLTTIFAGLASETK